MIDSKYRISLDIHSTTSNVRLKCKRGDTSRIICATLTENGFPYHISEDCYAVFTAPKPDGNVVFNECKINDNVIEYEFTPQTAAVSGVMKCEIKLYGADDKLITSPSFVLVVSDTAYDEGDEIESEKEVDALTHLISESTEAIKKAERVPNFGINAKVGQYLKISKVGPDGKVIEVIPVDPPAGGSYGSGDLDMKGCNVERVGSLDFEPSNDDYSQAFWMQAGGDIKNADGSQTAVAEFYSSESDLPVVLRHIANGMQDDDAVNVGQLKTRLLAPIKAAVGQYIRIAAVDENGVVTAVEAVDDPAADAKIYANTAGISVKAYHAVGDGKIDDTAAFQSALSANRCIYVPRGTYVLSDTIVIGENCCLELSQDTILQFTQTEGNCIEMRGSAVLRGNHAVISAPYEFTGNVISLDTALDGNNHASIPPYTKADPMWKRQRFVYDVNIIKPNAAGFNRSVDGVCNGTAIHMSAYNNPDSTTDIPWMWAITMSGIRIAGGFSYGIRAVNYDDPNGYTDNAWNHDMRIEAVIEGCEIGVALENCNGAHLKVTVQPNVATGNNAAYAKHGVYLNDSRFVDMIGSRVWDWNDKNSLWTEGGEYQHIALIGNCRGLLLDDFLCHEGSAEIRTLIYTDTPANFDTMSILQEPGNKHFKAKDGVPYFHDGTNDRKLMLATEKFTAEQAEFIHPADGYYTYTPNFTNLVSNYQDGYYEAGGSLVALAGYTTTDFIPIDGGDTHVYRIGGEGISWSDDYCYCRIAWYDSSKALKGSVMSWEKIGSSIYYPTRVEDENAAFAFATNANVAPPNGAAYFRITAKGSGANLKVTIDEPFDYTAIWHGEPKKLDDSIHAKNDWNAAEGEVGHIEHRTHYAEIAESIWLEETMVEFTEENEGCYIIEKGITPGRTYRVFWNGVEYSCEAVEVDGMVCFGNLNFVNSDTGVYTEPFAFIQTEGMTLACTTDEFPLIATFSVVEIEETVHKLPDKFIGKDFRITVTPTDTLDKYIADKTFVEIQKAYMDGKNITLLFRGLQNTYIYSLVQPEGDSFTFTMLCVAGSQFIVRRLTVTNQDEIVTGFKNL